MICKKTSDYNLLAINCQYANMKKEIPVKIIHVLK